jgi:hypothetical protein
MLLVTVLHFYQPYNQQEDILDRIVHESYLPLIRGLLERPQSKIVINVNGVLLRLLDEFGHQEVLFGMKELLERDQVEFTGSAMYHPFLPLLPLEEIARQIHLNSETCRHFLGHSFNPTGFFPPELAVNSKTLGAISDLGYAWVLAPQVAGGSKPPCPDRTFVDTASGLSVLFRNKRVSSLILSAIARNVSTLITEAQDLFESQKYWVTVMDAETFGHHRVGHEKLFFEILDSPKFELIGAGALLDRGLEVENLSLRPSTWTNEEQDFWLDKNQSRATASKSFILWKDPDNPIHKLQWDFVEFVLKEVKEFFDKNIPVWKAAREKLDIALASDQFWWASTNPWWSLEIVEQGAFMLKDVILTLFTGNGDTKSGFVRATASDFYRAILDRAFEWQRSGYIRKKHLSNSATFLKKPFQNRTPAEWYNQIVLEFEDEMQKSATNREFERAIKWRDALIKLRNGMDMYDVLHVVDELWTARHIPSVKPFLEHNWEEFTDFSKDNFRSRAGEQDKLTAAEFEDWKLKHDESV